MRINKLRGHLGGPAALLGLLLTAGCGDDIAGPGGPPGPDLTTVDGMVEALEEFYGKQEAGAAIALLDTEYRFHAARPESISFLEKGETSWDYDQQVEILDRLLEPDRVNWLDQVLLEITSQSVTYVEADSSVVELDAKVDLGLLVGSNLFERSGSDIVYVFRRDGEGNYRVLEERESVDPLGGVTVGEQLARVFDDEPHPAP